RSQYVRVGALPASSPGSVFGVLRHIRFSPPLMDSVITSIQGSLEAMLADAGERRRLVSVTVPVELPDPSAAVFASRLAGERWFCWEQPDRDGFALAGLGGAHEVVSRGPERFRDLVAARAKVGRGRLSS